MASQEDPRQSDDSLSESISRRDTRATQATKKEKLTLGGWVKKTWQKTGLDQPTILLMIKYERSGACDSVRYGI